MEDILKAFIKHISLVFSSGCLGGFINSIAVWMFGELGIAESVGVKLAPALSKAWLYPLIVWGGLWGFLFLLHFLRQSPFLRGLLYSLGPTGAQLFIVFPMQAQKGMMGFDLGMMTPPYLSLSSMLSGVSAQPCG